MVDASHIIMDWRMTGTYPYPGEKTIHNFGSVNHIEIRSALVKYIQDKELSDYVHFVTCTCAPDFTYALC